MYGYIEVLLRVPVLYEANLERNQQLKNELKRYENENYEILSSGLEVDQKPAPALITYSFWVFNAVV